MADNDIKKALECLASGCFDCNDGCKQSSECPVNIISRALDLINHKDAEIERLQKVRANILKVMKENISQTKSEAVKEFVKEIINNILPKYLYGKEETALRIGFAISERAIEMTEGKTMSKEYDVKLKEGHAVCFDFDSVAKRKKVCRNEKTHTRIS